MAFLMPINILSSFRYEIAIPVAKTDEEANSLTVVSLLSVCLVSALIYIISQLPLSRFLFASGSPGLAISIGYLPLGIFSLGCFQVMTYRLIRIKNFYALARYKVFQTISGLLFSILLHQANYAALIVGQILISSGAWIYFLFERFFNGSPFLVFQ